MLLNVASSAFNPTRFVSVLSSTLGYNVDLLDSGSRRRRRLLQSGPGTTVTVAAANVSAAQLQNTIVTRRPQLQSQLGFNISSVNLASSGLSPDDDSSSFPLGAIIGIVVGVGLLGLLVALVLRARKSSSSSAAALRAVSSPTSFPASAKPAPTQTSRSLPPGAASPAVSGPLRVPPGRPHAPNSNSSEFSEPPVALTGPTLLAGTRGTARYDFKPVAGGPQGTIAMVAGHALVVESAGDAEDWWLVQCNGKRGLVPRTHVSLETDTVIVCV
jgi:hypothetical protein